MIKKIFKGVFVALLDMIAGLWGTIALITTLVVLIIMKHYELALGISILIPAIVIIIAAKLTKKIIKSIKD